MRTPNLACLAAVVILTDSFAQDLRIRVRAPDDSEVLLMFSPALGRAIRIPGVGGVLELDPSRLVTTAWSKTGTGGIFTRAFEDLAGLRVAALYCQAAIKTVNGIRLTRMRQPLVDRRVVGLERSLPLSNNGSGEYLFGLSRQQIVATLRYYSPESSLDAPALKILRRPFDHVTCGDLAQQVGLAESCRILRLVWSRMLARRPLDSINAELGPLIDAKEQAWFDQRFPNGVPDDSPYWGTKSLTEAAAKQQKSKTRGDYRLYGTSGVTLWGVFVETWGKAESYKLKDGVWKRHKALKVSVTGTGARWKGSTSTWINKSFSDEKTNGKVVRATHTWFGVWVTHWGSTSRAKMVYPYDSLEVTTGASTG